MTQSLPALIPNVADLLALQPEELGAIVLKLAPHHQQNSLISIGDYAHRAFPVAGGGYDTRFRKEVELALAEAFLWLMSSGLIVNMPGQAASWFTVTRRGSRIKDDRDLQSFRQSHLIPIELIHQRLAEMVRPLFVRGDRDAAVFQAFREVEIGVRSAANRLGANYPDDLVGVQLTRKAFHPDTGPLRDPNLVPAEREAEMHLFSGAIGHAKNPAGHRDVHLSTAQASRLIVFASHLLSLVDERLAAAGV